MYYPGFTTHNSLGRWNNKPYSIHNSLGRWHNEPDSPHNSGSENLNYILFANRC